MLIYEHILMDVFVGVHKRSIMNRAFLLLTSLVTNKLLTIILLRTSLRTCSLRSLFAVNHAVN